jgi:hypothetical protein
MEYVGIDLHKKESQICLLTETGEVSERRIRTGIDSWPTRADAYYRILGPDSRNRLPRPRASPGGLPLGGGAAGVPACVELVGPACRGLMRLWLTDPTLPPE